MNTRYLSISVAAALALISSACVGNNGSLTVIGLSQFTPACGTIAGGTSLQADVLVDLNVARGAIVAPIVRNGLVATVSMVPPEVELHTILLEGANVKFRTGAVTKLADRFVHAISSVEPGQGRATVPMELLTSSDIDILRRDRSLSGADATATIVANIKVQGRMTDGGNITSSEIAVPIRLCRGCLQQPLPATAMGCGAMDNPPPPVETCNPGQDAALDFCSYEVLRR